MARLAIRMPKMSMTMTEGEVAEWLVEVDSEVAVGDVVGSVMTDKVDMDVESSVAGTVVQIVAAVGEMVPVGEPMAWLEGEDDGGGFGDLLSEDDTSESTTDDATATPPTRSAAGTVAQPEPSGEQAVDDGRPIPAVPRARALAREHHVDLSQLSGTGPGGVIRVNDVRAHLKGKPATTVKPAPDHHITQPETAPSDTSAGSRRSDPIRLVVARKMSESATVPQFTVWRELRLDTANRHRNGVSWTTALLRAYAAALRQVPDLLARWDHDAAVDTGSPCIALAVATDRGLMVPSISQPDRGSAAEMDARIRRVITAAQAGRIDPEERSPANASLSNLGGLGVDRFQALLTPPQASVLSLGGIAQRPVAVPGGVGLALTVHAGLTVDHRVADGAHGADLLARMSAILDAVG